MVYMISRSQFIKWLYKVLWAIGTSGALMPNFVWAQVIEDNTTRTRVESCGNGCINIRAGTQGGRNLFHSFSQFSPGRNTVRFTNNDPTVRNVINRVTGTSASQIDGLIAARGASPDFNVFLLNPNGIIFGANARLDIRGSFVATTANALRFGNQGLFSAADLSQNSALLTVNPSAFLFQTTPRSIVYQFDPNTPEFRVTNPSIQDMPTMPGIVVPEGEHILLVGGDIRLDGGGDASYFGGLYALEGGIDLAAIREPGTVALTMRGDQLRLNVPLRIELADITLTGAVSIRADNGGSIQLVGRRITLTGGSRVSVSVFDTTPGGRLTVMASEAVQLMGTTENGRSSGFFAQPSTLSSGSGGNVRVITQQLVIQDGAEMTTTTLSNSPAGRLTIKASDFVYLSGVAAIPNNQGVQQSSGLFSGSRGGGSGNAGSLRVETRRLIVRDGARVSTSSFGASTGQGGNLTVIASESVLLEGTDPELGRSGLLVGTTGTGNAGNLRVETGRLVVREGAQISAQSLGEGQSGRIIINAAQSVRVLGASEFGEQSRIATEAFGTGDAGRLGLTTRQLILEDNAELSTRTASGNGGNINLQIQDLLLLRRGSSISTTAGTAQGTGDGGNITINTGNGSILAVPGENSDITANAFAGRGGNINITANNLLGLTVQDEVTAFSDITASSELGTAGEIQLNTPNLDPTQGLTDLPVELATPPIEQRCYAQTIASTSEFIHSGRGGLPPDPSTIRTSGLLWEDLRSPISSPIISSPIDRPSTTLSPLPAPPDPIVEAQGWVVGANGQVKLVAQPPTVPTDVSVHSWQIAPPCPA